MDRIQRDMSGFVHNICTTVYCTQCPVLFHPLLIYCTYTYSKSNSLYFLSNDDFWDSVDICRKQGVLYNLQYPSSTHCSFSSFSWCSFLIPLLHTVHFFLILVLYNLTRIYFLILRFFTLSFSSFFFYLNLREFLSILTDISYSFSHALSC